MSELIKRFAALPDERRAAFLARLRTATSRAQPALVARPRTESVPLSSAQETLWFLDRLAPGRSTYNVSTAYRLRGPLDVTSLQGALSDVVARHESLRTSLHETPDGPVQRIAPMLAVELPVTPVAGADEADGVALATARAPFDLSVAPLWRARLLRIDADDHLLVFVVHHVVCDGWSLGVFARDLAACYAARSAPRNGAGAQLPDLPIRYADYTLWQREWLAGAQCDEQVAYWREQLRDAPVLEFPTDRLRPPQVSYDGTALRRSLDPAVRAGVWRLAQAQGVTPYTVLLTAFLVLLHRYCGQDDLVVGTPTANRGRVEVEDLVGFFVNMLVIRADLDGQPSTEQLLARVQTLTRDAIAHGDLPFEKLVEALRPVRDPSRSPLFQIAFTYQNAGAPLVLPGLTVRETSLDPGTARFDMSWNITETADGLELYVEYSTALFDRATIEQLTVHLRQILAGMVADPRLPVSRIAMVTDAEREELLTRWNGAERAVPPGTLVDLFAERVRAAPDAVALVVGGHELTYAELDRRAGRLAAVLRERGAAPGALVALCLPRSVELVVAVLGILRSGAGYVPLDPAYPPARVATMLRDAAPVAVVTTTGVAANLPVDGPERVLVDVPGFDAQPAPPAQLAQPALPAQPAPDDIAYVIYTSGTTGAPKGVLIEHRSAVNFIDSIRELFALTPDDRVLGFASVTFDVSVFEMFSALLTGARLYLALDEERLSPENLQRLLCTAEITVTDIPPAVMARLDPDRLPALRVAFVGCEAYSGELVERWNRGRRFVNGYGPTECTVTMIVKDCPGRWPSSPPIGLPMANHVAHVLDRNLELVPYGVPGELVLGGVGLTPGYLNAPELTAQKIVRDPFGTAPGGRLYRTGDLVRRNRDGDIVFLGRIDQQVKIRGLRIELGEVEAALATHPAVAQAVVDVWTDPGGDRHLVAYTTATGDTGPAGPAGDTGNARDAGNAGDSCGAASAEELRAHLAGLLPAWMVPAFYVPLDRLPLSVSGKVDRRALPPPDVGARGRAGDTRAMTPTERTLAVEIVAPMLGLAEVGVDDNFFALGGHSLQAAQLMSQIRRRFGTDVGLAGFFRSPTVAGLAALVDRGRAAALDDDAMLALVESMSDVEAAKLLASGGPGR